MKEIEENIYNDDNDNNNNHNNNNIQKLKEDKK